MSAFALEDRTRGLAAAIRHVLQARSELRKIVLEVRAIFVCPFPQSPLLPTFLARRLRGMAALGNA
jgi:hypothetical protein